LTFFESIVNSIEKSNEIACKGTDSKRNRIRPIKPITIAKNDAYSMLIAIELIQEWNCAQAIQYNYITYKLYLLIFFVNIINIIMWNVINCNIHYTMT